MTEGTAVSGTGSSLALLLPLVLIGPAALTLWLLARWHPGKRPHVQSILQVFLIGFVTAVPAIVLEALLFVALLPALAGGVRTPLALAALALGIGLSEEGAKLWFLRRFAVSSGLVRSLYDGVLFGVAIGLGFATIENRGYIYGAASGGGVWLSFALLRTALPAPAHGLFGVVMGFAVGRSTVTDDPAERRRWRWAALLVPAIWHGLFDFCALMAARDAGAAAIGWYGLLGVVVLALWLVGIWLIRIAHAASVPEDQTVAASVATSPVVVAPAIPQQTPTSSDLSVWARPR